MKKSFKKEKSELLAEVEFNKEEISLASSKAAISASQNITVPGFRKGKAPIEKAMAYISSQKFNDEVIHQLLKTIDKEVSQDKEFKDYIDNNRLANFRPDVHLEKFSDTEALFHVHYLLNPEVTTLAKYTGIKIPAEKEKVDDKKINDYIKDLAEKNAELIYKDGAISKGDTCNIDFLGLIKGKEFDGGSAKAYDLTIGSKQFIPGFEEKLIGHKSGDKVDIVLTLPENYPEPLANKEATFKVTINDVKEKSVPKIDDEFASSLSGKFVAKNLSELKDKVKAELLSEADNKYFSAIITGIFDKLRKESTFEISDRIVNSNVDQRIENVTKQGEAYGLSIDEFLKLQNLTLDKAKKNIKEQIITEIQNSLIFDAIAKKEKIDLPNNTDVSKLLGTDVNDYIKNSTAYYKKQGYSDQEASAHIQSYLNSLVSNIMQSRINNKILELNGYKKAEAKPKTGETKAKTAPKDTKSTPKKASK